MWQGQPLGRNSETVFWPGMVNHRPVLTIIRLNLNLNQCSSLRYFSVQCPHGHSVICSIWCLVQNYKGFYCTGTTTTTTTTSVRPVSVDYTECPAQYQSSVSASVLCVMWVELAELEQNVGTIPQNGLGFIPITCQFTDFESKINFLLQ